MVLKFHPYCTPDPQLVVHISHVGKGFPTQALCNDVDYYAKNMSTIGKYSIPATWVLLSNEGLVTKKNP